MKALEVHLRHSADVVVHECSKLRIGDSFLLDLQQLEFFYPRYTGVQIL